MLSSLAGVNEYDTEAVMYRILSLDGGGIRGVLTATLLDRLQVAFPGFLDKVNMFAGTSTGGLLALGLARGLTPRECRALYENYGAEIFRRSPFNALGDIFRAKYSNDRLAARLREQFGDLTLGDLAVKGKHVLISSFDLDNGPDNRQGVRMWKPKFFHNLDPSDPDYTERMVDVALRTSAAPAYFPTFDGYIDGGVAANNPAMCALAQALAAGRDLNEIVLLSIGTGLNPRIVEVQNASWGWLRWVRFPVRRLTSLAALPGQPGHDLIIDLLIEGTVDVAHYQCRQILKTRFHRLNPTLPEPIDLDRVDRLDRLKEVAQVASLTDTKTGAPTVDFLKSQF
jgi:patatin-like phospholipase/acyl hydrolase